MIPSSHRFFMGVALATGFLAADPKPEILEKKALPGVRTIQETLTWFDRIYVPEKETAILTLRTNVYTNVLQYDSNGYLTESINYNGWSGAKTRIIIDRDLRHWITNREILRNDRTSFWESRVYGTNYRSCTCYQTVPNGTKNETLRETINEQGQVVESQEIYRGHPQKTRRFLFAGTNVARTEIVENNKITGYWTNVYHPTGTLLQSSFANGTEKPALRDVYAVNDAGQTLSYHWRNGSESTQIYSNNWSNQRLAERIKYSSRDFDVRTRYQYDGAGRLLHSEAWNTEIVPAFLMSTSDFLYQP